MKINFTGFNPLSDAEVQRNEANARGLGFPKYGKAETEHLAVVGGGPSIANRLEDLKAWKGDIWAINGAFHWLRARGIDATFFSVDPTDLILRDLRGATHAVLGMCCHPAVFAALRDAKLEAFPVIGDDAIVGHSTTATTAPHIAKIYGYKTVTYFGCEGSWGKDSTHVYGDARLIDGKPAHHDLLKVVCNGEEFLTAPDMIMQAEFLAELIRAYPDYLFERSGGLLAAAIQSPDIDVIAARRGLYNSVVEQLQKAPDEAA